MYVLLLHLRLPRSISATPAAGNLRWLIDSLQLDRLLRLATETISASDGERIAGEWRLEWRHHISVWRSGIQRPWPCTQGRLHHFKVIHIVSRLSTLSQGHPYCIMVAYIISRSSTLFQGRLYIFQGCLHYLNVIHIFSRLGISTLSQGRLHHHRSSRCGWQPVCAYHLRLVHQDHREGMLWQNFEHMPIQLNQWESFFRACLKNFIFSKCCEL